MTDVISVKFRCICLACSVAWLAVRPGYGGVGGALNKGRGWGVEVGGWVGGVG